jgi:hypothetical protein
MKPNCAVLNPMTQMIRLFAAASTQPSQHLLPTRIVEQTVSTQDKQSSRNTSESTSSFISVIFPRIGWLVRRSKPRGHNLGNLMRLRLATVARAPSPARSMSNEGGRQIRRKALYGTGRQSRVQICVVMPTSKLRRAHRAKRLRIQMEPTASLVNALELWRSPRIASTGHRETEKAYSCVPIWTNRRRRSIGHPRKDAPPSHPE